MLKLPSGVNSLRQQMQGLLKAPCSALCFFFTEAHYAREPHRGKKFVPSKGKSCWLEGT